MLNFLAVLFHTTIQQCHLRKHSYLSSFIISKAKNIFAGISLLKNKTEKFSLILSFTIFYYGIHVGIFYAKV